MDPDKVKIPIRRLQKLHVSLFKAIKAHDVEKVKAIIEEIVQKSLRDHIPHLADKGKTVFQAASRELYIFFLYSEKSQSVVEIFRLLLEYIGTTAHEEIPDLLFKLVEAKAYDLLKEVIDGPYGYDPAALIGGKTVLEFVSQEIYKVIPDGTELVLPSRKRYVSNQYTSYVNGLRPLLKYAGENAQTQAPNLLVNIARKGFHDLLKEVIDGPYGYDPAALVGGKTVFAIALEDLLTCSSHQNPSKRLLGVFRSLLKYAGKNAQTQVPDLLAKLLENGLHDLLKEVVTYLIDADADITHSDTDGNKLIHFAAISGDLHTFIEAVRKGCDVEAKNRLGMNSLHFACKYEREDIVSYLVEHGVDTTAADVNGHDARWHTMNNKDLRLRQEVRQWIFAILDSVN